MREGLSEAFVNKEAWAAQWGEHLGQRAQQVQRSRDQEHARPFEDPQRARVAGTEWAGWEWNERGKRGDYLGPWGAKVGILASPLSKMRALGGL